MATIRHYRYYIEDDGMTAADAWALESTWNEEDADCIAEDAAENYHSEHDGWEASWPVTLVILNGDREIGRFKVERETVPEFTAARI